jgi:protein-tyrosine phosphatase
MATGTGQAAVVTAALSKLNFRDLGGIAAVDGRVLRERRLYRSEGPASFSPVHHAELAGLEIRLICDLRSAVEREAAPNDWSAGARLLNLEMTQDLRVATNGGWSALRDDPSEAGARRAMQANYAAMPAALQPHLAKLVAAILAGECPVLIHCTAGKDRTGVLVALLLAQLGAPMAAIEADYLRSDIFAKNLRLGNSIAHAFERSFGFVPSEATIDAMIGVDPDFLAAAFAAVTEGWGSVDAYFHAAGISAEQSEALRAVLLQ